MVLTIFSHQTWRIIVQLHKTTAWEITIASIHFGILCTHITVYKYRILSQRNKMFILFHRRLFQRVLVRFIRLCAETKSYVRFFIKEIIINITKYKILVVVVAISSFLLPFLYRITLLSAIIYIYGARLSLPNIFHTQLSTYNINVRLHAAR